MPGLANLIHKKICQRVAARGDKKIFTLRDLEITWWKHALTVDGERASEIKKQICQIVLVTVASQAREFETMTIFLTSQRVE